MANHVVTHGKGMHVCDTWHAMCVTHGMPCVTMHGILQAYIKGVSKSVCVEGAAASVRGSSKEEEEGKRRRRRKGEEKGRKGKEEGRKGEEKGKKK